MSASKRHWLEHTQTGRVSRELMDKAEIAVNGAVSTTSNGIDGVCAGCHTVGGVAQDMTGSVDCANLKWKQHLTKGRVAQSVWEMVSNSYALSTCGW